jgi:hypothetical protein
MAGIKNIRELYKKLGEQGLREALNQEIRITEKFDAYRFALEKNQDNYRIYYYGKNGKSPINKIDRTINDLYEQAIIAIESLPSEIQKSIPTRHRFGFSWFPSNAPLSTHYERRPKKGLVLTDITLRKKDSDICREIKDPKVLERWSQILGCDWNKPLYEGVLSSESIDQLINLAQFEGEQINESLFPVKGLLNETQQRIDSIVFEHPDFLFKLENNSLEEHKKETRSHLFDILLLEICEHLNTMSLSRVKSDTKDSDIAYLETVSEIFNSFVALKGSDFLNSGLERPKFLEKSGRFNSQWISNPTTQKIIESDTRYEYLFTVFLANLKKPKYPSGLLSESIVSNFNHKIEEISKIVDSDYSFLEFNYILNEEEKKTDKKDKKEAKDSKDSDSRVEKAITTLESFFNGERTFPTKEAVTVVVCNCSLITNKLVQQLEHIYQQTKKRIILFHDVKGDFLYMSTPDVEKIVSRFINNRNDIFLGYYILDVPLIQRILQDCDYFIPEHIYCSSEHYDLFQMETQNFKALWGEKGYQWKLEKLSKKLYKETLEIIEIGNSEIEFQKSTPEEMHPFWYVVKSRFDSVFYV